MQLGVIVLCDGVSRWRHVFYYTGSYSFKKGTWRGELITHQHTEAVGVNLLWRPRGNLRFLRGFT